MKVMVVGGGGREHALCWKLNESASVQEIICAPGNPGIGQVARCITVGAEDIEGLLALAVAEAPDLVVVGPEVALVLGLADRLRTLGFAVFGPSAAAAQLEGSKAFSKEIMQQAGVATAAFEVHHDIADAEALIHRWGAPIVIKASGLAAGKGVVIATDVATAIAAARDMLSGNRFGNAGTEIVIEACLQGEEASCLFIVAGETIVPLASSQDHKALSEGDTGPNTGGMGAYSPAPCVTKSVADTVLNDIVRPVITTLKERGIPFIGVLYAGIMICEDGPKTLEFNVRFGDPECQPLMMRLQSDLAEILLAAANNTLPDAPLQWRDEPALCVVVASSGYPANFQKGQAIDGLEEMEAMGVTVFHAGTAMNAGQLINNGGRVLGVTASASDLAKARHCVYAALKKLRWHGAYYRQDIAHRALRDV
ncbi:MAG: phosphoribosylamine--glycine ligase [Mariprofundaceae bacterium]|nr:phosphoribosylamine--glycine ligase [Mariprofundaceae bacterium]